MGSEYKLWNYRWYYRRIDNDSQWKKIFAFRNRRRCERRETKIRRDQRQHAVRLFSSTE